MGKSAKPSDDEPKPTVAKSALELQRFKLEKLMKNPEKPVVIPDRPREKRTPHVPEFVRNVMGSSAGAGSGEFHVYRHLRRKEYARQKFIQEKSEKQLLEEAYHQKLLDNKQAAEEKTAKKRAKRLKKKASKKLKRQNQPLKKTEIEEKSDTESDDCSDEGKADQADEQTCSSSISDTNECTNPRTVDSDQRLPLPEESHSHYSDTSVEISSEATNTDTPISSETNLENKVEPALGDLCKRNVDQESLRETDRVETVNKSDVTESEPE